MSKVAEFNEIVVDFMKDIIVDGLNKINDIKIYKIDYSEYETKNPICLIKYEIDKKKSVEDQMKEYMEKVKNDPYLGYYWFEFQYNGLPYKISMFYKDIDEKSGNIHMLPGMLQIWKGEDNNQENVSYENEIVLHKSHISKKYKRKSKNREEYKCSQGIAFKELSWTPLIQNIETANIKMVWDIWAKKKIYKDLAKGFWVSTFELIVKNNGFEGMCRATESCMMYTTELLKEIYDGWFNKICESDEKKVSGKSTYSLYKWITKGDEMISYCKMIWLDDCQSYFAVFDGDGENTYLSLSENICGPNYLENFKWIINYKYYSYEQK